MGDQVRSNKKSGEVLVSNGVPGVFQQAHGDEPGQDGFCNVHIL
jgi:hypothetical protein